MDKYYKLLRELAKSEKWQNFFTYCKEFNFDLFINKRDLSYIQQRFLDYLSYYNTIYVDIYLGDVKEEVLEKEIYEDAYMVYRRHKMSKIEKTDLSPNLKKEENERIKKNKPTFSGKTVFKSRKK